MHRTRFALLTLAIFAISPLTAISQELINQKSLSADLALAIAQGAIEKCRASGHHVKVGVIDASAGLKAFIRDDGTSIGGIDLSRRKAFTALTYRRPSSETVKAWKSTPPPIFMQEGTAASPGGVPIKAGNDVIGAVGVSGAPGGDNDEGCANAGLAKAADKLK